MDEWCVYGQEKFKDTAGNNVDRVDNPKCITAGVCGEQATLPFTVPEGFVLQVEAYGVEAYDQAGTVVLFPWLGPVMLPNNQSALHSCGSSSGSNECLGFRPLLPAKTVFNVTLLNGESVKQTCSWYVRGKLLPV